MDRFPPGSLAKGLKARVPLPPFDRMPARIKVDREKLGAFCRRHHIQRLSFFGSVLREDFTPTSDVDVLVEFEPGHIPGLAFFEMQEELSAILNRRVDLHTPNGLSPYFREQALAESEVEYVEA